MPQLKDFPFIELLREFAQQNRSGAVRLERNGIRAVVYIESGKPVFAASNTKQLRLRDYLVKRGVLSQEQLAPLCNVADARLLSELSRLKLLDSRKAEESQAALVTDILRVLSLWIDGEWEYEERARLADSFRASVNLSSLLLSAARNIDSNFIATRLRDPSEIFSPSLNPPSEPTLLPVEAFVLSRLEQPMPLGELMLLSGQSDEAALRIIYGLALTGLVDRTNWRLALKETATRAKQPRTQTAEEAEAKATDKEELQKFFARVESAETYYDVLDSAPTAPLEEIKRTYYGLARRYHPDRFHGLEVHARLESAFARITQAYETLTDEANRATYDAKLAAQEKVRLIADAAPKAQASSKDAGQDIASDATGASAEDRFKEGFAALQLGQVNQAISHLAAAARSAPNEPRYRAFYGKALAKIGKGQRLAESELQAAVKLDPNNATYHFMLAQLYYQLSFFKRSRAEAMRATELDPNHAEAQALLRRIEMK